MKRGTSVNCIKGTSGVNNPLKNDTNAKNNKTVVEREKDLKMEEAKINATITTPSPISNNWLEP